MPARPNRRANPCLAAVSLDAWRVRRNCVGSRRCPVCLQRHMSSSSVPPRCTSAPVGDPQVAPGLCAGTSAGLPGRAGPPCAGGVPRAASPQRSHRPSTAGASGELQIPCSRSSSLPGGHRRSHHDFQHRQELGPAHQSLLFWPSGTPTFPTRSCRPQLMHACPEAALPRREGRRLLPACTKAPGTACPESLHLGIEDAAAHSLCRPMNRFGATGGDPVSTLPARQGARSGP